MALSFRRAVYTVSFVLLQIVLTVAARLFAEPASSHGRRALLQQSGKVLTDYIGASSTTIAFTEVPLDAAVSYIFPLAFAIDADSQGNTANGVFSSFWGTSLTPESAVAFAQANSNVRISVSLAGASQYISETNTRNVQWYDPADPDAWIANAVSSITALASQYAITGIDINYEDFTLGSATFTHCIGELITRLKTAGTISVASIAPFGSVVTEYTSLYQSYNGVIDYVNYQFYAEGLTTQAQYVSKFNEVAGTFDAGKLMASVNVDGSGDAGLTGDEFIGAVKQLGTYAGIMIWEADDSKKSGFAIEKLAAAVLTS